MRCSQSASSQYIFTRLVLIAVLAIAPFALVGCSTTKAPIKPQVEQVPVEVVVPVATGCIADTGRPARPKPLNQQMTADE